MNHETRRRHEGDDDDNKDDEGPPWKRVKSHSDPDVRVAVNVPDTRDLQSGDVGEVKNDVPVTGSGSEGSLEGFRRKIDRLEREKKHLKGLGDTLLQELVRVSEENKEKRAGEEKTVGCDESRLVEEDDLIRVLDQNKTLTASLEEERRIILSLKEDKRELVRQLMETEAELEERHRMRDVENKDFEAKIEELERSVDQLLDKAERTNRLKDDLEASYMKETMVLMGLNDELEDEVLMTRNELDDAKKRKEDLENVINCSICMDHCKDTLLDCGHACCRRCLPDLTTCHICREFIKSSRRIFFD